SISARSGTMPGYVERQVSTWMRAMARASEDAARRSLIMPRLFLPRPPSVGAGKGGGSMFLEMLAARLHPWCSRRGVRHHPHPYPPPSRGRENKEGCQRFPCLSPWSGFKRGFRAAAQHGEEEPVGAVASRCQREAGPLTIVGGRRLAADGRAPDLADRQQREFLGLAQEP